MRRWETSGRHGWTLGDVGADGPYTLFIWRRWGRFGDLWETRVGPWVTLPDVRLLETLRDVWGPLEILGEAGTEVPQPVDLHLWQEVALGALSGDNPDGTMTCPPPPLSEPGWYTRAPLDSQTRTPTPLVGLQELRYQPDLRVRMGGMWKDSLGLVNNDVS
ncbi:unnamed protein product [Arctogadus glacialis]